jgi:D-arabinose 1-dehydrogenase-like Zn-dependent alcohol dehydrogenase
MGFDVGEFQLCAACGVCHSDLHVINKDQPYPIPCVLGHGKHTDPATVKRFGSYALTLQVHHAMFPFKYSHQNRRG